jgi:hypothetical protein
MWRFALGIRSPNGLTYSHCYIKETPNKDTLKQKQKKLQRIMSKHLVYVFLLLSVAVTSLKGHVALKVPDNGGAHQGPAEIPCQGKRGVLATPLQAGGSMRVEFNINAAHEGGGCQFGLSYDNGTTYTLIMTTDASCPMTPRYDVPIPANAPSCKNCIIAWGWIPVYSIEPQYYMNCVQVQINGSPNSGPLQGTRMVLYNMLNFTKVFGDHPRYPVNKGFATRGLTAMWGVFPASNGTNSTSQVQPSPPVQQVNSPQTSTSNSQRTQSQASRSSEVYEILRGMYTAAANQLQQISMLQSKL